MLAEFRAIVEILSFKAPVIPVVSNVAGGLAEVASAGYWVEHVRATVRFADGVKFLASEGVTTFLELGPDAVLTALGRECVDDEAVTFVPLQRRDRPEERELVAGLAAAQVRGERVDWPEFFDGARRVDLPTYAFARRRFWLTTAGAGGAGTGHPLAGAAVTLADTGTVVLTGRLTPSWTADHRVDGTAVFPAAGFVELALRAGAEAGCGLLEHLTVPSPLVLPVHGTLRLQVVVGPAAAGSRPVTVHTRLSDADEWQRTAEGSLADGPGAVDPLGSWPPPGAEPLDVDALYERLADAGLRYGPAFGGLRRAWRRGDEIHAEIALPEGEDNRGYGLHPALLDTVLHSVLLTGAGQLSLPSTWTGVRLHGNGADFLRARLAPNGDGFALTAEDNEGRLVLTAASVTSQPISPGQFTAGMDALFRVEWSPVTTAGPAEDPQDTVVLRCALPDGEVTAANSAVLAVLEELQRFQDDEEPAGPRLVVLTRGAMDGQLAHAPVRGLVRAAQAERPGRFVLIDTDASAESDAALTAAVASGESELMIRDGEVLAPRLARVPSGPTQPWPSEGAALVTGATSALGRRLVRHLAAQGVRRMVLVTEPDAETTSLVMELAELGAQAQVKACDLGDRDALAALLDGLPTDFAPASVLHLAASEGRALLGSVTPELLDTVLGARADAAWHLHDLTRDRRLARFVVVSEASGTLLPAGRAAEAAASTFLDTLAAHRRSQGLPGTSLVFGPWAEPDEPGSHRRTGLASLLPAEGLPVFDQALALDEPVVVAARLDLPVIRELAGDGTLPSLLRGLVRLPARTTASADSVRSLQLRLLELTGPERDHLLENLVRAHAATVLGHGSAAAVPPERPFRDLGFDSLGSVELRNRLTAATGVPLSSTLVFDHPTVRAVAELLGTTLGAAESDPAASVLAEVDRLEAALAVSPLQHGETARVLARLDAVIRKWQAAQGEDLPEVDYTVATDEELFDVLDGELGLT